MSAKGINIAEECHVVNILPPVDANDAAANSDVFSMENFAHASIIIQCGVSAGAVPTFTVEECSNFTPSASTAIGFRQYAETTAAGDTLGAGAAVASTGTAMGTDNGIFYVLEIDASELTAGYGYLRVCFTDPGASALISAVAILSGQRYQGDANATAIA